MSRCGSLHCNRVRCRVAITIRVTIQNTEHDVLNFHSVRPRYVSAKIFVLKNNSGQSTSVVRTRACRSISRDDVRFGKFMVPLAASPRKSLKNRCDCRGGGRKRARARVLACMRGRDARCDAMCDEAAGRCAGIVNVMLMVLMGSRCRASGMRIQSHAGVTLLPVYMAPGSYPPGQITQSDLREPNEQPLLLLSLLLFSSFHFGPPTRAASPSAFAHRVAWPPFSFVSRSIFSLNFDKFICIDLYAVLCVPDEYF